MKEINKKRKNFNEMAVPQRAGPQTRRERGHQAAPCAAETDGGSWNKRILGRNGWDRAWKTLFSTFLERPSAPRGADVYFWSRRIGIDDCGCS